MSRTVLVVFVILGLGGGGLCSSEELSESSVDSIAAFENFMRDRMDHTDNDAVRNAAEGLLHQVRNHEAMSELVAMLGEDVRPQKILYLASGSHMAPLALCELIPRQAMCNLLFTEIDASVEHGIDIFLKAAGDVGLVVKVTDPESLAGSLGSRVWNFEIGGRRVRLELLVEAPGALIRSGSLKDVDLVISHDWSGDPMGNLVIIRDFMLEARSLGGAAPPLLMIEDLEAHPYPVDLSFFGPIGRSGRTYGHRSSNEGIGRHGTVELGVPIFGGAVLLGFDDRWWSQIEPSKLEAFIDFLLFYRFDSARQNVLEGGQDPLLAPTLLDWWTGFGTRSIHGPDIRSNWAFRRDMVATVLRQTDAFSPLLQVRIACALQLYRSILEAKAQGEDVRGVTPDSVFTRRPVAGAFPSNVMEELYKEALENIALYQTDREDEAVASLRALEQFGTENARRVLALCPCNAVKDSEGESWINRYRTFEGCLE